MTASAIVIGATGGLGGAIAAELEAHGQFDVQRMSRAAPWHLDLLDEISIVRAAAQIRNAGSAPQLIIVATGLLHRSGNGPEKSIRQLDPEWMMENYRINAIGPALVAKHFLPLMPRDRRTCFAVLSARVGSISDNRLGGWHSYRASKAALNLLVRNMSIEWQRINPKSIIIGLHPGTVETHLSAPFKGSPATERLSPDKAATLLVDLIDRVSPEQSGQLIGYDGVTIAP